MGSPEPSNWFIDYGLIEGPEGNFAPTSPEFDWPLLPLSSGANGSSHVDAEGLQESGLKKRNKSGSCGPSTSSKACREKLRRNRLNDKFAELGRILETGRTPKTDKAAILIDAIRVVTQLRDEAQKLKESNSNLEEKIKELKAEKNELREEKQRLKSEKEKLEHQLKQQTSVAAATAAFVAGPPPGQMAGGGNKLMVPIISYPGVAMWQFMPPSAVDTSQDHVLRPPVA